MRSRIALRDLQEGIHGLEQLWGQTGQNARGDIVLCPRRYCGDEFFQRGAGGHDNLPGPE
jgi:hypothetical protein